MKINEIRQSADFEPAALSCGAKKVYSELYGNNGEVFFNTLLDSPQEIAVVSRLFAHVDCLITDFGGKPVKEENDG